MKINNLLCNELAMDGCNNSKISLINQRLPPKMKIEIVVHSAVSGKCSTSN